MRQREPHLVDGRVEVARPASRTTTSHQVSSVRAGRRDRRRCGLRVRPRCSRRERRPPRRPAPASKSCVLASSGKSLRCARTDEADRASRAADERARVHEQVLAHALGEVHDLARRAVDLEACGDERFLRLGGRHERRSGLPAGGSLIVNPSARTSRTIARFVERSREASAALRRRRPGRRSALALNLPAPRAAPRRTRARRSSRRAPASPHHATPRCTGSSPTRIEISAAELDVLVLDDGPEPRAAHVQRPPGDLPVRHGRRRRGR